ncbi:WD repeat protein 82, partial [Hesseltinella vesiculosa]
MDPQHLPINANLLSEFKPSKIFKDPKVAMTSLSFDDSGQFCATSAQDESIRVYDCTNGSLKTTLYSKKYGVGLVRFNHDEQCVVYASTKEDDTLRYLSLHNNQYIRYFKGHTDKVITLEMSTLNDQFLSSSLDGTVRLWDMRSSSCQGMLTPGKRPIASIDPAGMVFPVVTGDNGILVYDIRQYSAGPFSTWSTPEPSMPWTSVKFTNDGKHLLLTSAIGRHWLLDAYNGTPKKRLQSVEPRGPTTGEEVTLTPDGKFALEGGPDGLIRVWDLEDTNSEIPILSQSSLHAASGVHVLGFNPVYMMMVSGGTEFAMWEPSNQDGLLDE